VENEQDKDKQTTETVVIDGHAAEVSLAEDGTINVTPPDSLIGDPDALAKWKKDVESMGRDKLLPKLYKNRRETDEEVQRLRDENAKLKASSRDGQPGPTPKQGNDPATQVKPLHERLGLNSEDDLDEYMSDNPKEYRRAADTYYRDLAQAEIKRAMSDVTAGSQMAVNQTLLANRISSDGYSPQEFQAWLQYQQGEGNTLQFNESAYRLYKASKADKSDPVLQAQLNAQKASIKFVEKGNGVPSNWASMTDAEVAALPEGQRAARKAWLIKQAQLEHIDSGG
jgi:hypothetical protein